MVNTKHGGNIAAFKHYVEDVFKSAGLRGGLAVAALIVVGLTEGVGLLMLIPFLQLIGVGDSAPTGVVAFIGRVWGWSGLPLTLPAVLLVYAVIVSLYAAAQRWSTLLNSRTAHAFTRGLRNRLFEALARMQWLDFTRMKSAEIYHVLTTNLTAIDNGVYSLFALISMIFIMAVRIAIAFALSVPMTVTALVGSALLLLVLRPLNRQSYTLGEEWRSTMSSLFGVLGEHLGAMKLAKSYGAEGRHVESFQSLSVDLENQANKFAGILATTQMFYEIGAVAILGLFFYVAVAVLQMPAAKLLIMVFLFAGIIPQVSWMQRAWQGQVNMLPAYNAALDMETRLRRAEESLPEANVPQLNLTRNLEFRDVTFRYDAEEGAPIIDAMNLILPASKNIVILGPSGGGKSTFADLLMGLLKPDAGEILIDGAALEENLLHSWRRSVAYVPQESVLFHATLKENLLWAAPEATDEEIHAALRMAAADEFVNRLPEGLNTVVGDRGMRISGGERQRVALARAILRKPALLLLDEATSQLDRENEKRIIEALDALRGSTTVVFISHRLSALRCADQIVVVDRGRVVESGTYEELAGNVHGRFRSILSLEQRGTGDQEAAEGRISPQEITRLTAVNE